MRINTSVAETEHAFSPAEQLISVTDKTGIITDANKAFMDIGDFSRGETVRRSDMPPEARPGLWQTLKAGTPSIDSYTAPARGVAKRGYRVGQ
jgi:PAS domain-containing protein